MVLGAVEDFEGDLVQDGLVKLKQLLPWFHVLDIVQAAALHLQTVSLTNVLVKKRQAYIDLCAPEISSANRDSSVFSPLAFDLLFPSAEMEKISETLDSMDTRTFVGRWGLVRVVGTYVRAVIHVVGTCVLAVVLLYPLLLVITVGRGSPPPGPPLVAVSLGAVWVEGEIEAVRPQESIAVGGRLGHFIKAWAQRPTPDPSFLKDLGEGYSVPFHSLPPLSQSLSP